MTSRLPAKRRPVRWVWIGLAYVSLTVAAIGVAVPGLPTTPFALLAAYCASRGSTALHERLLAHRVLGPVITDWERDRTVSRGSKYIAVATMAISAIAMFLLAPSVWYAVAGTAAMAVVACWLVRRPEPVPADLATTSRRGSRSDDP